MRLVLIGDLDVSPQPRPLGSHGAVQDFLTATHRYEEAVRQELRLGEASLEPVAWWRRELWAVRLARELSLLTTEEPAAVTIAALRAAGLTDWADAYEANDYRGLEWE